jgi:glucose-6-phosphate isomerase
MTRPTEKPAWQALQKHHHSLDNVLMRQLFATDAERFERFSVKDCGILLDYSKNRITDETLDLLCQLAEQCELAAWRDRMYQGQPINHTENRPVLHTALRNRGPGAVTVDGRDVMPAIHNELQRMRTISERLRNGEWAGYAGTPVSDVVNIGIGGSDLGPLMVTEALKPYVSGSVKVHFVSNVDESQILTVLSHLNPETTLFIVASKSFTTRETHLNMHTARTWLKNAGCEAANMPRHFIAVTAALNAARAEGFSDENMLGIWDWVGGRYSLWSAIGLPIAIAIGMNHYEALLQGGYDMDEHFRNAPLRENMPVIMALLGIWYANFFNRPAYAILPYDYNLHRLPAYLQQADMESNGKSVDRDGNPVNYQTGPVIFGEPGINAQHAFYQLLHQGSGFVPADFIVSMSAQHIIPEHRDFLMANVLAQAEALMKGRTAEEACSEMAAEGIDREGIDRLLPYRVFAGNRPTNTLVMEELTPRTLGSLIALYEHKIFVQGIIWGINSFDQWGVELGKTLAGRILADFSANRMPDSHDCSTNALIEYYLAHRNGTDQ